MTTQVINNKKTPRVQLANGELIPIIGLGTFGSDHVSNLQVAAAVEEAILLGYRHIDCAEIYGNEKEIGEVLARLIKNKKVKREELWITSKVWNNHHKCVEASCRQSLKDLQLDYLDLYLVHWPFPNHHEKGVTVDSRDHNARPFILDDYLHTWQQAESLIEKKLVRNIGCSNMTIAKFDLFLPRVKIKPLCHEMEIHPHFPQEKLFQYCMQRNIQVIGYCPIGSPGRPERDRTPEDTVDIEDPVILGIAHKYGIRPVAVCLKWAVQRGQITIPFSANPKNIASNLAAVSLPDFTADEMRALCNLNKNCRLVKGHVFLWDGAKDWQDLWDEDGYIAGK